MPDSRSGAARTLKESDRPCRAQQPPLM